MERSFHVRGGMDELGGRSFPKLAHFMPEDVPEEISSIGDIGSSASFDRFCSDLLGQGSLFGSPREAYWEGDDSTSTSHDSSPLGWVRSKRDRARLRKLHSLPKVLGINTTYIWDETTEKEEERHEIDMMKERFAKLLLGEDMSGGAKGVCPALAISNAITNLSASVFGGLWRLEPLAVDRKLRWHREMDCLLSVCDYIVEFVPSSQKLPNGNTIEVMVTKIRPDLQMNLPALRKLDTMLLESLESYSGSEFWYADWTVAMGEKDGIVSQKQDEKWWLPCPCVPFGGLCEESRKHLQQQRDCTHQILKAALTINGHVLQEMEIPNAYWEALPRNGRSSLGEALYHILTLESFNPEAFVSSLDCSNEHKILELVNRIEAAAHIWHRKLQMKQAQTNPKDGRFNSKGSLSRAKDSGVDLDRKEVLAEKAESLLLLLRQRFPGLPQTILDTSKIQYNKDVGRSVLESYSRVLECIAFNILSRIDDVLHVDCLARHASSSALICQNVSNKLTASAPISLNRSVSRRNNQIMALSSSPTTSCSAIFGGAPRPEKASPSKTLSDIIGWKSSHTEAKRDLEIHNRPSRIGLNKSWSFRGNINS